MDSLERDAVQSADIPMETDEERDPSSPGHEHSSSDNGKNRVNLVDASNTATTSSPTISFLTYDDVKVKAKCTVQRLCEIVGIETQVAEQLLKRHRWDIEAAVVYFISQSDTVNVAGTEQEVVKHEPAEPKGEKRGDEVGDGTVMRISNLEGQVPEMGTSEAAQSDKKSDIVPETRSSRKVDQDDAMQIVAVTEAQPEQYPPTDAIMTDIDENNQGEHLVSTMTAASADASQLQNLDVADADVDQILAAALDEPDIEASETDDTIRASQIPPSQDETEKQVEMDQSLSRNIQRGVGASMTVDMKETAASMQPQDEISAVWTVPTEGKAKSVSFSAQERSAEAPPESQVHRASRESWRQIKGESACAMCFEEKNGDTQVLIATDCGIVLCAQCWGGYIAAEFSGGINSVVRCPSPQCNAILPLWLLEQFYENRDEFSDVIIACYRSEFVTDFVLNSDAFQFCPSPTCNWIIQRLVWTATDVVCRCGHAFCFSCLKESHFPAECVHAKEVATIMAHKEMHRLAHVFEEARKCTNCGASVKNPAALDSFQCTSCQHVVEWSRLSSCSKALEKSCRSLFPKCESGVEKQLTDVIEAYGNWEWTLSKTHPLQAVPNGSVDSATWCQIESAAQSAIRLLKWTKVWCLLEKTKRQDELCTRVLEHLVNIHQHLQAVFAHVRNQNGTTGIFVSLAELLQGECLRLTTRLKENMTD